MTAKKRTYQKPVIQDLGNMLAGSAQLPMGLCSSGDSPSEAQNVCQGGNGVATSCPEGNLFQMQENVCQAGGDPVDYCGFGSGLWG